MYETLLFINFRLSTVYSNGTNLNLEYGSVILSPSTQFEAQWIEGSYNKTTNTKYATAQLYLKIKTENKINYLKGNEIISLHIYARNGIGVDCGFPSSFVYNNLSYRTDFIPFTIAVNTTKNSTQNIPTFSGIGNGCTQFNDCSGHGTCNYCTNQCTCMEGYGAINDVIMTGRDLSYDCSKRVCPKGRQIVGIPTSATIGHSTLAECSNVGNCNRDTGECKCFPPFTGSACERSKYISYIIFSFNLKSFYY